MVPAPFAHARRVRQAAHDLIGEHGAEDHGLPAGARIFGGRQNRRDIVAGVAGFLGQIGVHVVLRMHHRRIGEHGEIGAGEMVRPEHRGAGLTGAFQGDQAGDLAGLLRIAAHGDAERIDDASLAFQDDLRRERLEALRKRECRQPFHGLVQGNLLRREARWATDQAMPCSHDRESRETGGISRKDGCPVSRE